MIIDQTSWGHIRTTGADRARFLQGMCTANVEALEPGGWTRASILNTKGRVVSVIEIAHRDDHLLLTCEPQLTDKTLAVLDKHAIMDDVEFARVDQPMHRIWDSPQSVWDAPPVFSARPGPAASEAEYELLRVEAGMPSYGRDVSEDNFPFESLLDRYVDYNKGCYLGQEPVSRVHHRGGANKALRGLQLKAPSEDNGDNDGNNNAPPAPGTAVSHPEREAAGIVTSSARSPRLGPIALALIHRSVFAPGTEVEVDGRPAVIVELPFASA